MAAITLTRSAARALRAADIHLIDLDVALDLWADWRITAGRAASKARRTPLMTPPSANVKFGKDGAILTFGWSFAQDKTSGTWNMCPFATPACRAGCVAKAGKGELDSVKAGRKLRTDFLLAHPSAFVTIAVHEIVAAVRRYGAHRVALRLNAFSDQRWEELIAWLFKMFPDVHFYDYTKDWSRTELPANYHLTYSVSEVTTDAATVAVLESGRNVAVVFATKRHRPLPETYLGFRVIDGDKSDARHLDPRGVVVGLRAKGRMIGDTSGMVRAG